MKHSTQHQGEPSNAAAIMTMRARPELRALADHGRPGIPRAIVVMDSWSRKILGFRLE